MQVESAFKALGNIVDTVVREAQTYVSSERKQLQEAKAMADNTTNAEILRLQQQNAHLTRMLEAEKAEADRAKDELIKRISGLLGDFTAERDRSLREAFSAMTESNTAAEREMIQLSQEHGKQLEDVVGRGKQWSLDLEKRGVEGKRARDGGIKVGSLWYQIYTNLYSPFIRLSTLLALSSALGYPTYRPPS